MMTRRIDCTLTVSRDRARRAPGFTLVEILVATVILGLVISIVLGAFRSVFGRTDAIGKSLSHSQMVLSCFNRLLTDVQGTHVQPALLYRPPQDMRDNNADPYRWVGDTQSVGGRRFSRLRFASRSHVSFGTEEKTGVAEIVYYVQQAGDKGFALRRADRLDMEPPFEPKPWDPVVCRNVKAFALAYLDGDAKAHEDWDSDDPSIGYATARAVRIRIDTGEEGQEDEQRNETLIDVPVYREGKK